MGKSLLVEDARILFLNFAGKEGRYNREGDRNFCVLLEPDLANDLSEDGWRVKYLKHREGQDPDEPRQAYLPVVVEYRKGRPPKITLVTYNGKTPLGEEECEIIDMIDIEKVDLILNGHEWSVNGDSGIKAYLKTLYVVVREDQLDVKYRHLDELPTVSGRVIEAGPDYIEGEVIEGRLAIEQ
jgi:hypothetical protein